MQIYAIKSIYNAVPLAEIRTDGKRIEFIVDNTGGKLPKTFDGDFEKAKKIVAKSHHIKMEHPQENVPGLLRYVLENNDIIEMTTDGKTSLLNGELLTGQEKEALFYALSNGHLKVKQKADLESPIMIKPKIMRSLAKKKEGFDPAYLAALKEDRKQKEDKQQKSDINYDYYIEDTFAKNEDDKKLAYVLKYGFKKGI